MKKLDSRQLFDFPSSSIFASVGRTARSVLSKTSARMTTEETPFQAVRLHRRQDSQWSATEDDPQFVFPIPKSGPSVIGVFLDARPNSIDPSVFFDWGDGFHESEKVYLGDVQIALLRLSFEDRRGLKRLRLDPAQGESEFRFFCWSENDDSTARASAEREFESARAEGYVTVVREIDALAFAPEAEGRPIGSKRQPRNTHEHFLQIVEVARKEFEGASPAAGTQDRARPLISLEAPVYNTPENYLDDLLNSFRAQTPGLAELVLSDDASTSNRTKAWLERHRGETGVVVHRCAENGGIAAATNEGIDVSRGEWIGLVDHDDALAPYAIAALAKAIEQNPDAKFIYTDEAIADDAMNVQDYFFKPAFDSVMLSGMNYINHLSLYQRERLLDIGGLRPGYDGSQDYDLLLRYLEGLEDSEIRHLPYPAYIWRRNGASYSVKYLDRATKNARRALAEAYASKNRAVTVDEAIHPDLHRVRFDASANRFPKLSIIIPNKDSYALIAPLLNDLCHSADYPDYEVIVVDNGSTDKKVLNLYASLEKRFSNFTADIETAPFNFSRQVNRGMKLARGELLLLLNNDIEIIDKNWLKEMASCFNYRNTGIVGARLLYPTRKLQHAGVIVGLGGLAGHWFTGRRHDFSGPMARLNIRASMTAVTGACMMISRSCLTEVGWFDEQKFAVAYNDVDFCLRATRAGFRVVYTPFATLVHHESISRGMDDKGANRPRFLRDQAALLETHATEEIQDRAYSPWYGRRSSEPNVIMLDELPSVR